MDRLEVLRREFDRIATSTDEAYRAVTEAIHAGKPTKLLEAAYREWATLLLRYHDALARVLGKEPAGAPASMKGKPEGEKSLTERLADITAREARYGPVPPRESGSFGQ